MRNMLRNACNTILVARIEIRKEHSQLCYLYIMYKISQNGRLRYLVLRYLTARDVINKFLTQMLLKLFFVYNFNLPENSMLLMLVKY